MGLRLDRERCHSNGRNLRTRLLFPVRRRATFAILAPFLHERSKAFFLSVDPCNGPGIAIATAIKAEGVLFGWR